MIRFSLCASADRNRMRRLLACGLRPVLAGVVACILGVAPATAQGLPTPMQPCLQTHFDPARYQAELEARGWSFIPALNRAAQIDRLAQAFGPLSVPDGTPDAEVASASRVIWRDRGEAAMIFDGGGETLMLSGVVPETPGEAYTLRCYVTVSKPAALDSAFAAAEAQGQLQDTPFQFFRATTGAGTDRQLELTFTRPNPTSSSPAPAGIATRYDFPAPSD